MTLLDHAVELLIAGLQVLAPPVHTDDQAVLHTLVVTEDSQAVEVVDDGFHLVDIVLQDLGNQGLNFFALFCEHVHGIVEAAQVQQPQIHKAVGQTAVPVLGDLQREDILGSLHRVAGDNGFHALVHIGPDTAPLVHMLTDAVGAVGNGGGVRVVHAVACGEELGEVLHQLLHSFAVPDPHGGQQAHGGGDHLGGFHTDGFQKINITKHGYSPCFLTVTRNGFVCISWGKVRSAA